MALQYTKQELYQMRDKYSDLEKRLERGELSKAISLLEVEFSYCNENIKWTSARNRIKNWYLFTMLLEPYADDKLRNFRAAYDYFNKKLLQC